jgi:hypothetical protein
MKPEDLNWVAIVLPKHWRRDGASEDGDDMQSKIEKQKGALKRLGQQLSRYKKGDWTPSVKDKKNGRTLDEKIKACVRAIEVLEEKLG